MTVATSSNNLYVNDHAARTETAAALGRLLADSYTLYLKTQGFHWNVVGPRFEPLHSLFQEQYTELAAAIDEIAERIRALGAKAPASFAEFATLTSVDEEAGAPAAEVMLESLLAGEESKCQEKYFDLTRHAVQPDHSSKL